MNILKILNSKIKNKLIFGFFFISLLAGVVGLIGLNTIWKIERDYERISTKSLPLIQDLENMKFACVRLVSSTTEYAFLQMQNVDNSQITQLEEEKDLMQESCILCHESFSKYEQLVNESFPEALLQINEIKESGKMLHIFSNEITDLKKQSESSKIKEEFEDEEMKFLHAMNHALSIRNDKLTEEKAELSLIISSSFKNIMAFSLVTLFLSLLISILYSRSISRPIVKLTQLTDDFRKGNMDVAINIQSTDEIGVLSRSFNAMAQKIKLLIFQLEEEVKQTTEAEELIRKSNQQIKLILDVAGEGIIGLDVNGNHTFVNPRSSLMLGYKVEELIGKNSHALYHHSYQDGTVYPLGLCPVYETLNDGKIHRGEEYFWKKDGTCFPVIFSSIPIFENKKITGAVVTFNDISDRKRAEESFLALSRRNEILLQTASDGIHITDERGNIVEANEAFCSMLGYKREEMMQLNVADWDMKWSGEELLSRVGELITHPIVFETRHRRKDGSLLEVEISAVSVTIEGRNYNYAAARDITDRKRIEEELRRSNEELIKINAEKDKFFSIIAHDLRSPFSSLLGISELIASENDDYSKIQLEEFGKSINTTAQNIFKLLNNLLDWAQLQKGTMKFAPEDYPLKEKVDQAIETINQRALQKGIIMINEVGENQKVFADEKMISSILRNLLSNAVKFTRSKGIITVKSKNINNDRIEISVNDTGIGISSNNIPKLFKIDEKFSVIGTDGEPSTGLGLLLCKEFVEMHGGKIWVESELEKGSTFSFLLPLQHN
ncbi:MAG: PAS domain S-box protein [Prolixibacteraceae bacterium]